MVTIIRFIKLPVKERVSRKEEGLPPPVLMTPSPGIPSLVVIMATINCGQT